MSLPSYVVNWDELKDLLESALGDYVVKTLRDVEGAQRIRGFAESVPALNNSFVVAEWIAPVNCVFTGVAYSQSAWNAEDNWDLYVSGEKVFSNIHTKELGEHKTWDIVHPINNGDVVQIVLNNESGSSKNVWCDIEYIELKKN